MTSALNDHLDVEPGIFSPGSSLDYHLAVRRVLLPDAERLLQMVVLPSFEPEFAVYVRGALHPKRHRAEPRERTVVTGRATSQIWGGAMERSMGRPDARGVRVTSEPTEATFPELAPDVDWARAPLGNEVFDHLYAVWEAALVGARPRTDRTIALDGVAHHFANARRSGLTTNPPEGSIRAELVSLGAALAALATLEDEGARSAREQDLVAHADRLLARIHAS
jgi:hypothetical protein